MNIPFIRKVQIKRDELGFLFHDGEFNRVLETGTYWTLFLSPLRRVRVDVAPLRAPWITHGNLDAIVDSGALEGRAEVIDLKDHQRVLVWVDGRFDRVLGPGLHALWTQVRDVTYELRDTRELRFEHEDQDVIFKAPSAAEWLNVFLIEEGHVGVAFKNGEYLETLQPGKYATWNDAGKFKVHTLDIREKVLDVVGQDIMTADKVTLRMNAVVTYRIDDPVKAVTRVNDVEQAMYRETQLAIRAEVGLRLLDRLLGEKNAIAEATADVLKARAAEFGIEIRGLGIRDIILPGDMKDLLNKVIEAQKIAEANVIKRREETAAMRSQANTAKLLEQSDVLMRLRELEVLEKIAQTTNLSVVLGDEGLRERLFKLV
jgi:regulator of protease activity HflC (stomatin/prohibitin superfamily)